MRYSLQPMNTMKKLLAILIFTVCHACAYADAALPEIALAIQGHKLTAEVAANDGTRATGLMHRRMMPENRGMLFVFPHAQPQSFWMMNTYLKRGIKAGAKLDGLKDAPPGQ
ncbi:MAG: DUF192 domain-containing protein [Betaproteobacteria bacterium]|nr:DUF192 domain-containing protein [Betaproteobacteria bacterium]